VDAGTIAEVAALYGSPVDPRRKDSHINCPFGQFHRKGFDSSQGLSVKIVEGGKSPAWCFSCNTHGTLAHVFAKAAELDDAYLAAAEFIAKNDGASLGGALARFSRVEIDNETPNSDWTSYAGRCARLIPPYLLSRGIIQTDIVNFQLGYDDRMERAVFPVKDADKKVVGCIRRAVVDGQNPKYLDTPGAAAWKRTVFYGEHRIDRTISTAYLVEGPMGTIFASRIYPNVLGIMGASTGIGEVRLEKLKSWGVKLIILMLDSDKAGQEAVYGRWDPHGKFLPGLRQRLRPHFAVKIATLPEKQDPDDLVRRNPNLLREVVSGAKYLVADAGLTGVARGVTLPTPKTGNTLTITDYLRRDTRPPN